MATLETEHVFEGDLASVFAAIGQYEKYPEYIPGVTKIEVLPPKASGSKCQVRYELNIIKTFYYTLDMFEQSPSKIWWSLADSNIMKHSNGSWDLKSAGTGKTKAVYKLDIKFKGLIPGAITDQVAKANIPAMMAGFQKLISGTKVS